MENVCRRLEEINLIEQLKDVARLKPMAMATLKRGEVVAKEGPIVQSKESKQAQQKPQQQAPPRQQTQVEVEGLRRELEAARLKLKMEMELRQVQEAAYAELQRVFEIVVQLEQQAQADLAQTRLQHPAGDSGRVVFDIKNDKKQRITITDDGKLTMVSERMHNGVRQILQEEHPADSLFRVFTENLGGGFPLMPTPISDDKKE